MSLSQRPPATRPGAVVPAPAGQAPPDPQRAFARAGAHRPTPASVDWPNWLRRIERRRRQLDRLYASLGRPPALPPSYLADATRASFRLEGLGTTDDELTAALAPGAAAGRAFRPRQAQRLRNHVAILRHLEKQLARGDPLKPADVVRWYTSLACGLSVARLDGPTLARVEQVVRQVNSPHLRLRPALCEITRLHLHLLNDPLFPSFHGPLARLLLRYHLGRCRLPPVVFNAASDGAVVRDEHRLLPRLLELIEASYAGLLKNVQRANGE